MDGNLLHKLPNGKKKQNKKHKLDSLSPIGSGKAFCFFTSNDKVPRERDAK